MGTEPCRRPTCGGRGGHLGGLHVTPVAELRELGGFQLTLTLPMVSSLAKLCVHQILVVLRPFFGLSVAAEGCEGEEGAAAGPSSGKGGAGDPPHLAVPLTWLPGMSGAEGMRCSASRCCSIPVSSCSLAWHSDSSARGTGVREGARGTPARPHAPPRAPLTGRAALQPLAVLQPGVHLVPGAGQRGQGRGAARGQDPCPLALQQGTEGMDGCQEPLIQVLSPRAVTHLRVGTPPGTRLRLLAVVVGAKAADPAGEQLRGFDLGDRGELVGDLMPPALSHGSSSPSTVAP